MSKAAERRRNEFGTMHARRACELPFVPTLVRDFCIRGIATIQLGAFSNDQFFCS